MLERHEIEAFLALADELHFGRAADRIGVSPSRISQILQRMERQVGASLFDRTSRRVQLTPVGSQLRRDLAPAWDAVGGAFTSAVEFGRGFTGRLKVGFVGAAGGQILVDTAAQLQVRHPMCDVRITETTPVTMVAALHTGELDIALTPFPVDELEITCGPALLREMPMVAVPAGHVMADRAELSLSDLATVPVLRLPEAAPAGLRQRFGPSHTSAGVSIPAGPAFTTMSEALTLVTAGQGVAIVGAHVARYHGHPGVRFVPLRGHGWVTWGLCWYRSAETARIREFAAIAGELLAERRG